jgi:hypothetical protein
MAAERRELPASFMYEPGFPPTIPPGVTIADWRRRRARRKRHRSFGRLRRVSGLVVRDDRVAPELWGSVGGEPQQRTARFRRDL